MLDKYKDRGGNGGEKHMVVDKKREAFMRSIKFFFFKQKTAYEISACLVGSGMCIRGRCVTVRVLMCECMSVDV